MYLLGEKPFQCDICKIRFRAKTDLIRHSEKIHFKFECIICSFEAESRLELAKHEATHDKAGIPHQCRTCSFSADNVEQLRLHLKSHNADQSVESPTKPTATTSHLPQVQQVQQEPPVINLSNAEVGSHDDSDAMKPVHMQIKDDLVCPYCNATFYQRRSLSKHMANSHVGDTRPARLSMTPLKQPQHIDCSQDRQEDILEFEEHVALASPSSPPPLIYVHAQYAQPTTF